MAIDWVTVRNKAISAAENSLGGAWAAASGAATAQISNLIQTAQYIAQHQHDLTEDEAQLLAYQQKHAMQNVLTAYVAIGIAAAQNAIAAVVNVILAAAPGLLGFA
ncbi:hypothetical protein [Ralstonia pseudosolanacearum]|uniref:hypothetical protein n=1 Tax=Ralstonia pseudosolanacearum TaxID=1310165 RepID=UPI001FF7D5F8|nr:hypothetical protein [Ralstonia pseudosolanacearum]